MLSEQINSRYLSTPIAAMRSGSLGRKWRTVDVLVARSQLVEVAGVEPASQNSQSCMLTVTPHPRGCTLGGVAI